MNEQLIQDWEEASLARQNGDSEFAKTQAILTAKVFLAEAGLQIGARWEDIPEEARKSALRLLREHANHSGLGITKGELRRQAQSVIERDFRLPERLAYKVIYESYGKTPEITAERKSKLALLEQVANGERVEGIPEYLQRRIQRRVAQGRRYLIAATDLREACGREGYLKDSYTPRDSYTAMEMREYAAAEPERIPEIRDTNEWWDLVGHARMNVRQALNMVIDNENVNTSAIALSGVEDLVTNVLALRDLLIGREQWNKERVS